MGNGVGKVLGVVAGAAISCIPGVGPVAAMFIFAGTTLAGSGVDALFDSAAQNSEADKVAAEEKRKAAIELEKKRVEARRKLEEEQREVHRQRIAVEQQIEGQRQAVIEAREAEIEAARVEEQQLNYVNEAITACQQGEMADLPVNIQRMDDQHYEQFANRALHACQTADAREACFNILQHEEMRRAVANEWQNQINHFVM